MSLTPGFADKILLRAESHFSLMDRLLILIGRPLLTNAEIDCEHEPGKTQSRVISRPARICWPGTTRSGCEPIGAHVDGLSDFANLNGAGGEHE